MKYAKRAEEVGLWTVVTLAAVGLAAVGTTITFCLWIDGATSFSTRLAGLRSQKDIRA